MRNFITTSGDSRGAKTRIEKQQKKRKKEERIFAAGKSLSGYGLGRKKREILVRAARELSRA